MMDLENYEQIIKERLKKRRITPSEGAWDQLEEMLKVEERSFKKAYWWIATAACFILGLFIVKSMTTPNMNIQKKSIVALNPDDSTVHQPSKQSLLTAEVKTDSILNHDYYRTNNTSVLVSVSSHNKDEMGKKNELQEEKEPSSINKIGIKPIKFDENKEFMSADSEIEKYYGKGVQIAEKEEATTLLHKAKLELEAQIKLNNSKNMINSAQLLNEVEDEIHSDQKSEESIHQRVVHFVKDKYKENKFKDKVNQVFVQR